MVRRFSEMDPSHPALRPGWRARVVGALVWAGALVCAGQAAAGGPLNCWSGKTDEERLELVISNGYSITDQEVRPSLWVFTGIHDHFDFGMSYGLSLGGDVPTTQAIEFMARYYPIPALGIAAHLSATAGGPVKLGAELHYQRAWGWFQLTNNLIVEPSMSPDGVIPVELLIAPELLLHPHVSLYTEVDMSYDFRGRAGWVGVVPGFTFILDNDGYHELSVGVQIGVYPDVDLLVGAWYWVSLRLPRKR